MTAIAVMAALLVPGYAAAQSPLDFVGDPRLGVPGRPASPEGHGARSEIAVHASDTVGTEGDLPQQLAPSRELGGPISLEQPIDPLTYLCGPGDLFELSFWGQQNMRLSVLADLEGRLFIDRVGFVDIAHKTLHEVREIIRRRVRKKYPGLDFDVSLRKPRTFLVHVVDNVKMPGPHTARAIDRVSTLLERAEITGSERRISIQRLDGSTLTADLRLYRRTGEARYNPFLQDGDVVRVPNPEVTVEIQGAVHHPGKYELLDGRDLSELVFLAGGFKSEVAKQEPIRIVRRDETQRGHALEVPFGPEGEAENTPLRVDDLVLVRSIHDVERSVFLVGPVEGASEVDQTTASTRLPFVEGDTVRTLLERAGEIKAGGDLKQAYLSRPVVGGRPQVIPVDLEALIVRRDFSADVPLQLGDELVIPPLRRGVTIQGAVAKGGVYPYHPHYGVAEFIAQAGGTTKNARSLSSAFLVHPSGEREQYSERVKVRPGDAIVVPERNFSRSEIVSLLIAAGGLVISGLTLAVVIAQ